MVEKASTLVWNVKMLIYLQPLDLVVWGRETLRKLCVQLCSGVSNLEYWEIFGFYFFYFYFFTSTWVAKLIYKSQAEVFDKLNSEQILY